MKRASAWFTGPGRVEVRESDLPAPGPGQALAQTLASAISPGTELLIYRGQMPAGLAADETLAALGGRLSFPLKYGYAAVARVIALGSGVDPAWHEQLVFAFNPHETHFVAAVADLHPVPPGLDPETALFLPNMETAVNFLLDGRPLIGERAVVFGQGVVGLLTTALLAAMPLASLVTLDRFENRRTASLALGAHLSLDPAAPDHLARLRQAQPDGADLTFELSGAPAALDPALAATRFAGRVVIGSWYGSKRADLDLGGRFHRSRLTLISSQVSSLTPDLHARWTKARRLEVAWRELARLRPAGLITHRLPLAEAARAYDLLDRAPHESLQVVLTY